MFVLMNCLLMKVIVLPSLQTPAIYLRKFASISFGLALAAFLFPDVVPLVIFDLRFS